MNFQSQDRRPLFHTSRVLASFAAAAAFTSLAISPAVAAVSWTPAKFRTISGIRPFVEARLNGKPFLMMVHANASFYAMTTHANAASIGLADLKQSGRYGISADGHVSELGIAKTTLSSLQIGDDEAKDVSLQVFEIPDPTMQGMLGVQWLRARRVLVDYDKGRIGTSVSAQDTEAEDQRLLSEGYIAHRMTWDEDGNAYRVSGSVDGTPVEITVATVGESLLDTDFARSAHVELGPVVDQFGGPSGSVGDIFITRHEVSFVVDGQVTAPVQARAWNVGAYDAHIRKQEDKARIGSDFMLANQAMIDFGSATLFLRPR